MVHSESSFHSQFTVTQSLTPMLGTEWQHAERQLGPTQARQQVQTQVTKTSMD